MSKNMDPKKAEVKVEKTTWDLASLQQLDCMAGGDSSKFVEVVNKLLNGKYRKP